MDDGWGSTLVLRSESSQGPRLNLYLESPNGIVMWRLRLRTSGPRPLHDCDHDCDPRNAPARHYPLYFGVS